VSRLLRARSRAGLDGRVHLDHHPFLLEEVNGRPTPQRVLAAEIPILADLDPDAGWRTWRASPYEWPVSTLLPAEAVQAAKAQGLVASEALDRALRVAFFRDSRCITMRHVVLEIARETPGVDAAALEHALDDGAARRETMRAFAVARDVAKGSPHVFLPDGTDSHNPGIDMRPPDDDHPFPHVERDDPSVYEQLVRRAAGQRRVA
jgi:predicted DsbA family dithiol-disulfide isomerase